MLIEKWGSVPVKEVQESCWGKEPGQESTEQSSGKALHIVTEVTKRMPSGKFLS